MTDGNPHQRSQIDVTTWSDAGSRDALSLVAASVAEMVGFEIAIISVVRGEVMYAVAVEGSNDAAGAMTGVATPMSMVMPELDRSDDWGRFRFVPHERVEDNDEVGGWIPDIEVLDAPDAWHPLDLLLAPLYDLDGALIGMLSIDVPMTGLRPDPTQRHLLERYAVQAERTLRMAVERNELAERIRLAEAAHRVVRFATSQSDLENVLDDCRHPLLEGFRADFLSIRVYEADGEPQSGTRSLDVDADLVHEVRALSRRCWETQQVLTSNDALDGGSMTPDTFRRLNSLAEEFGLGVTLLVPVGAAHQSLGHLILGRKDPTFLWSADEQAGALDIARDIGQAVVNARQLAREQRLVAELRRLATYKSQLLSTVSHELKNPLSAVSGHVEILESNPELDDTSRRHVTALDRAARRMVRVVDDLLLLASVEDPDTPVPSEPLDVKPVLADALELIRVAAESREIAMTIDAPVDPVLTRCDPDDLDRVLTNLLSNAVKYSPRGGAIHVTVTDGDEVEIAVTDEGIGISSADLDRLFTEFFRSTNPQAVAQPGTGLGLTICRRIVERHGGRIDVVSALGEGSTFSVHLPAV